MVGEYACVQSVGAVVRAHLRAEQVLLTSHLKGNDVMLGSRMFAAVAGQQANASTDRPEVPEVEEVRPAAATRRLVGTTGVS